MYNICLFFSTHAVQLPQDSLKHSLMCKISGVPLWLSRKWERTQGEGAGDQITSSSVSILPLPLSSSLSPRLVTARSLCMLQLFRVRFFRVSRGDPAVHQGVNNSPVSNTMLIFPSLWLPLRFCKRWPQTMDPCSFLFTQSSHEALSRHNPDKGIRKKSFELCISRLLHQFQSSSFVCLVLEGRHIHQGVQILNLMQGKKCIVPSHECQMNVLLFKCLILKHI